MSFRRKHLMVGIASVLAFTGAGGVWADGDRKIDLEIKAQSAKLALLELGRTAKTEIVFSKDAQSGISLPELSGEYTLTEALDQILKGSGLVYNITVDGLILIQNAKDESEEEGKAEVDEEVIVTGSRIRSSAASTSHLEVITRDDFEKLGLNSAEDIVRYLPQNFSTVNVGTTLTNEGQSETPAGTLGQSAASLRGLGSKATLVLVNGRRIAGSPSFGGDGTINLSTIPSAAIDRVEVLLEGASAIYGSDALGGVINFILRKDWSGSETTVRYENGAHGGDAQSVSQVLGTIWETGNASLTLSYNETDAVNAFKAGFTTLDLRSRGGGDYRTQPLGQFGPAFYLPSNPGYVSGRGSLPEGTTGSDWTGADLSFDNMQPYDRVAVQGASSTATSTDTSVTVNFEQELGESLVVFGDVLYAKRESDASQKITVTPIFTRVGANNPHNNLGIPVTVDYLFQDEPLPRDERTAENTRLNANIGVNFDLSDSWKMSLVGSYGEEEGNITAQFLGGAAYLSALEGFQVDENRALILDGGGNPIPVPALNLFTGEHDAGIDWNSLVAPSSINGGNTSKNESLELSADGTLFSISGGDVKLALGGQIRRESYDLTNNSFQRSVNNLNEVDPNLRLDNQSAFFEASIPAISEENSLPGVQELFFTVAGRWENYSMEHQFDGPDSPEEEKKFSAFSPKVGFMWQPVDDVRVRASWSESFRAPSLLELGIPTPTPRNGFFVDIDHPDFPGQAIPGPVLFSNGGNPQLDPETAVTISAGIEWTPSLFDGLTMSATYTQIDWEDRIDQLSIWDVRLRSNTDLYPDLYVRGQDNFLVEVYQRPINLSQSMTESIDFIANYDFDTEVGAFFVKLAAVYTLEAENTVVQGEDPTTLVETDYGPDELVIRGQLGWTDGDYGMNLMANYSSSYDNTSLGFNVDSPQSVEHYTTIDLTGFYNTENDWEFKAGVRNIFNTPYPFFDSQRSSYDPKRVDTRGRIVYLDIAKSFDF